MEIYLKTGISRLPYLSRAMNANLEGGANAQINISHSLYAGNNVMVRALTGERTASQEAAIIAFHRGLSGYKEDEFLGLFNSDAFYHFYGELTQSKTQKDARAAEELIPVEVDLKAYLKRYSEDAAFRQRHDEEIAPYFGERLDAPTKSFLKDPMVREMNALYERLTSLERLNNALKTARDKLSKGSNGEHEDVDNIKDINELINLERQQMLAAKQLKDEFTSLIREKALPIDSSILSQGEVERLQMTMNNFGILVGYFNKEAAVIVVDMGKIMLAAKAAQTVASFSNYVALAVAITGYIADILAFSSDNTDSILKAMGQLSAQLSATAETNARNFALISKQIDSVSQQVTIAQRGLNEAITQNRAYLSAILSGMDKQNAAIAAIASDVKALTDSQYISNRSLQSKDFEEALRNGFRFNALYGHLPNKEREHRAYELMQSYLNFALNVTSSPPLTGEDIILDTDEMTRVYAACISRGFQNAPFILNRLAGRNEQIVNRADYLRSCNAAIFLPNTWNTNVRLTKGQANQLAERGRLILRQQDFSHESRTNFGQLYEQKVRAFVEAIRAEVSSTAFKETVQTIPEHDLLGLELESLAISVPPLRELKGTIALPVKVCISEAPVWPDGKSSRSFKGKDAWPEPEAKFYENAFMIRPMLPYHPNSPQPKANEASLPNDLQIDVPLTLLRTTERTYRQFLLAKLASKYPDNDEFRPFARDYYVWVNYSGWISFERGERQMFSKAADSEVFKRLTATWNGIDLRKDLYSYYQEFFQLSYTSIAITSDRDTISGKSLDITNLDTVGFSRASIVSQNAYTVSMAYDNDAWHPSVLYFYTNINEEMGFATKLFSDFKKLIKQKNSEILTWQKNIAASDEKSQGKEIETDDTKNIGLDRLGTPEKWRMFASAGNITSSESVLSAFLVARNEIAWRVDKRLSSLIVGNESASISRARDELYSTALFAQAIGGPVSDNSFLPEPIGLAVPLVQNIGRDSKHGFRTLNEILDLYEKRSLSAISDWKAIEVDTTDRELERVIAILDQVRWD